MAEIPFSCPRCGAKNASGAWICWRCNSTLVAQPPPQARTVPPPPPIPALAPPTPATTVVIQAPVRSPLPDQAALVGEPEFDLSLIATPRRSPRSRQPIVWAMMVASVGLLVVAPFVLKGVLPKDSVQLPTSLQGYTRVDDDPEINHAKEELAKVAFDARASVAVGVYRKPGKGLVVELFTGAADSTSAAIFGTVADELASAGLMVDRSNVSTSYPGGISQTCAPVGGKVSGSLCLWSDYQRVALVMGINAGVEETSSLAQSVRQAVNG